MPGLLMTDTQQNRALTTLIPTFAPIIRPQHLMSQFILLVTCLKQRPNIMPGDALVFKFGRAPSIMLFTFRSTEMRYSTRNQQLSYHIKLLLFRCRHNCHLPNQESYNRPDGTLSHWEQETHTVIC